jgi:hypothetical protein
LVAELDAHHLRVAGHEYSPGAPNQRFRGDARHVDTSPTDLVPLDHGDLPARLGAIHRQRLSRLAASDDQKVDVLNIAISHHRTLLRSY